MELEFKRLQDIPKDEIIELMSNPLVIRHMPLATEPFDYEKFIASKEELWVKHGYGPWAFVVDGKFVGWGGLQYEDGDADLAMVLHPDHWGMGKMIYDEIIKRAFGEMGFESVTVLFPPSRKHIKGLLRLNFRFDGETVIQGKRFLRFRLRKPDQSSLS